MNWHTIPKDDAWKQVTLAYVAGNKVRLWVHCACGRQRVVEPEAYAAEIAVPMTTPLLAISLRLRCTRCYVKSVKVWPEPYGIGKH